MKNLLCKLGIHDWEILHQSKYFDVHYNVYRVCLCCKLVQRGISYKSGSVLEPYTYKIVWEKTKNTVDLARQDLAKRYLTELKGYDI